MKEEEDININTKNKYILTDTAVKKLLLHQNTMVDIQEIVTWVDDYRKLKERKEHDHLLFCGCSA